LNLVFGVVAAALFVGGLGSAPGVEREIAGLLGMTVIAIGLCWLLGGLNRLAGSILVAAYLLFLLLAFR
jgi:apolipoprotein N-acyltransferase